MSAWSTGRNTFAPGGWEWPEDLPPDVDDGADFHTIAEELRQKSEDTSSEQTPLAETKVEEPEESRPTEETITPTGRHWRPRTCRICLEQVLPTFVPPNEHLPGFLAGRPYVSYESESGKLIRPCKCKGSARYVHEQCLQEWRHSDRTYTSKRHYFECPTCHFSYSLERLTWARYISSSVSQLLLTLAIFIIAMFLLGFVGDFIINIYLDPVDIIVSTLDHDETSAYYVLEDEDVGWLEHFAKGFASLGILGFAKVFFANPLRWWNFRGTGTLGTNRAGTTGRDRVANTTWVAIFIGVGMMLYSLWKGVRTWSRRVLEKAGEKVVDVQGEDLGDDDEDEPAAHDIAAAYGPSEAGTPAASDDEGNDTGTDDGMKPQSLKQSGGHLQDEEE